MMLESFPRYDIGNVLVKDVMTTSVVSVHSSTSANDAAKMMEASKIGSILVVDGSGPIGIITDRDFTIKITAHAYPIDTPVKRIMSSSLITITSDSSFWEVADLMLSKKIRKIPVVDDNVVAGIITDSDLVNHLVNHEKNKQN